MLVEDPPVAQCLPLNDRVALDDCGRESVLRLPQVVPQQRAFNRPFGQGAIVYTSWNNPRRRSAAPPSPPPPPLEGPFFIRHIEASNRKLDNSKLLVKHVFEPSRLRNQVPPKQIIKCKSKTYSWHHDMDHPCHDFMMDGTCPGSTRASPSNWMSSGAEPQSTPADCSRCKSQSALGMLQRRRRSPMFIRSAS